MKPLEKEGGGQDGNEERRERRTGGGEIISHWLAGTATGGSAGPQLIIPSCLRLPAASGRSHDVGEAAGAPDWMLGGRRLKREVVTRDFFFAMLMTSEFCFFHPAVVSAAVILFLFTTDITVILLWHHQQYLRLCAV